MNWWRRKKADTWQPARYWFEYRIEYRPGDHEEKPYWLTWHSSVTSDVKDMYATEKEAQDALDAILAARERRKTLERDHRVIRTVKIS